jgi:HD superfamily phosphohydrolase
MADIKKVFRDPIHNLISFDKKEDKPILQIIGTPEFQRLRRIRQLGLSSYTYPTAVHDRFSHSLGVAYIVGVLFDRLNIPDKIDVISPKPVVKKIKLSRKQLKLLIQLAGLLHDIGHGPFSHAFEKITNVNHEEMSKKIILNEEGNIYRILTSIDDEILKRYSADWIVGIISGTFQPAWARELISSQLDADRIDYLLRDAYMCGVNYASFDIKWLFQNIELSELPYEGKNVLGLVINTKKGIHAAEAFIVSRYHMYAQVYYHKTTRGFEIIAQKIFGRLKQLVNESKIDGTFFINSYLDAFLKDNTNLDAYLGLDDFCLYTHFNHWINSEDEILSMLCRTLIDRQPYKMFKEVENASPLRADEVSKADICFRDKGIDLENEKGYYLFEDEFSNVAYKDDYLIGKKSSEDASHIWLKFADGSLKEFAEESSIVQSLRNKEFIKRRGYVHRDFYKDIDTIIHPKTK